MKKLITILFILITFTCSKSQTGFVGRVDPVHHSLIIFSGESNAGGFVQNDSATALELLTRPMLNIINNYTLQFESLQVGVNNLLLHVGLTIYSTTRHGWEVGLANSIDSGKMALPTYVVKTGQGGSNISNWSTAGGVHYWDTLVKRVNAAKTLLTTINSGQTPAMFLFYSQGVNDRIAGTSLATWKVATKNHFDSLRNRYGFMPIFMTYLPASSSSFNSTITEICSEVPDCYPIETSDLPTFPDGNHWTYTSMKIIATRMMYTLKAHYNFE